MKFEIEMRSANRGTIKLDGVEIHQIRSFVLRGGVGQSTTLELTYVGVEVSAKGVEVDVTDIGNNGSRKFEFVE